MSTDYVEMILKTNLKAILKERGMSVAHLSKQSGVAVQTLHNWLSGLEPRNLGQVKQIADYLEVSIDDLCFGLRGKSKRSPLDEFKNEINCGVFEVVLRKIKIEICQDQQDFLNQVVGRFPQLSGNARPKAIQNPQRVAYSVF